MKKVFLLAFLFMGIMSVRSFAQEATEEVTEEEILKFATMEESVANFLAEKQEELVEMIKGDSTLGGAARYNEIKAAWGKEDKLAEIKITEAEKAAFQKIQDFMDSLGESVKNYKVDFIKDAEKLGAATYNKVMKAKSADPSINEKINSMIAALKEKRAAEDGNV
ncbi:hypothetical protein MMU07_15315 [Aquiflexum sp. LQ15W]|uniref:hypothetical protein n=1 Tax=Cognataquiflexum nitidum TaxID=2922272 RepID=UPI001F143F4A|nr:hypothetical protein [Cognataquiflexum nitidum]MCH6200954.1 hypothetical protein [Cognataquiflexum nitidum]